MLNVLKAKNWLDNLWTCDSDTKKFLKIEEVKGWISEVEEKAVKWKREYQPVIIVRADGVLDWFSLTIKHKSGVSCL